MLTRTKGWDPRGWHILGLVMQVMQVRKQTGAALYITYL